MNKWFEEACFYHFFTFGACNAPFNNDFSKQKKRINELEKWIPHIKELNCNAILLSPVFESQSHGYDCIDYNNIDSRLCDNESFKHFVQLLHDEGIKIVLDGVFNHCGREFFAFKDIIKNREKSKYCSWFSNLHFNVTNQLNDPFSYDCWAGYLELPKFNLENDEVKNYLLNAVENWITYFDIDGLRLDAAECLSLNFINDLNKRTSSIKDDFWLMGEVVNKDYREFCDSKLLHTTTNYELYKGFYSSHNEENLFEIAYSLNRQFNQQNGIYNYFLPFNFVDNHDQSRLASIVDKPQYLYTIYILLFSIVGIPSIYYGSELGIKGLKSINLDKDIRPYIDITNYEPQEKDLLKVIKKLSKIRKNSKSLMKGDYQEIFLEYHKPFVFKREVEDEIAYVVINPNDNDYSITIEDNNNFYDALNDEIISNMNNICINKYWGRILIANK